MSDKDKCRIILLELSSELEGCLIELMSRKDKDIMEKYENNIVVSALCSLTASYCRRYSENKDEYLLLCKELNETMVCMGEDL